MQMVENITFDVIHRIVNGHAVRNGATRAVDIEVNILLRVLPFQIEQLRHHKAGRSGIHIFAQHNNAVIEQAGKNIVAALTARSLFDYIGYKAHRGSLLIEKIV